jgi:DNA-binding NarL/FixJ family response regulator
MAVVIERAVGRQRGHGTTGKEPSLTPRERQTVTLLADGLTNKEIATRMGVSVNTVKAFIRSVMLKLEVTTRAGIVGRIVFPS